MKFIHFADCHLDGFRDKRLSMLGFTSFEYVINQAINNKVDFVLLAGDLFNTAIPRVDALKFATTQLKRLQENNIPVYAIAGSHDFSSQGKSILDVLEIAGLLINVMKGDINNNKLRLEWTKDEKTDCLISGIIGKRGMLDKKFYEDLDTSKLQEQNGFKIFMFHTALEELKTPELEKMEGFPVSMLPSGCNYYAGGHVHIVKRYNDDNYPNIIYPGPTYPNSFSELEKLKQGSFVFYDSEEQDPVKHVKIPGKNVILVELDAQDKTPKEVSDYLIGQTTDLDNCVVLIRLKGTLSEGKIQDIDIEEVVKDYYEQGAFIVLKNTSKLSSKSFEEITNINSDQEDVELSTIKNHLGMVSFEGDEEKIIHELLNNLDLQQVDGEKKTTFTDRVIAKAQEILER